MIYHERNPTQTNDSVSLQPEIVRRNALEDYSLPQEKDLFNFVTFFAQTMPCEDEFINGSAFAYELFSLWDVPSVSHDTLSEFITELQEYHRHDIDIVKIIQKRDGEKFLKPFLQISKPVGSSFSILSGDERLGAYFVANLKEREIERINQTQTISEPIPLVPNVSKIIKSA